MTLQEQLKAKELQLEGLQKQVNKLEKDLTEARKQRNFLRNEIAKEQGLLKSLEWKLTNCSNCSSGFTFQTTTRLHYCRELQELYNVSSYGHFGVCLADENEGDIELRFDDGDIALRFCVSIERMQEFIKEWELKVDTCTLNRKIVEAQKKVDELIEIKIVLKAI